VPPDRNGGKLKVEDRCSKYPIKPWKIAWWATSTLLVSRCGAGRRSDWVQIQTNTTFTHKITGKDTGGRRQTQGNIDRRGNIELKQTIYKQESNVTRWKQVIQMNKTTNRWLIEGVSSGVETRGSWEVKCRWQRQAGADKDWDS